MSDPIHKTEIKITVLSRGPFVVEGDDNDPFDLAAINYAITYGDCLGQTEEISSAQIPADKVVEECIALGNDGEFFNDDEFEDEEVEGI